jgi:predicted secreted protein
MKRFLLILLTLALLPVSTALAADPAIREPLNRVEFQVRAEREAGNDLARATLAAESEHGDPARLAAVINETMRWALEQARAAEGVQARSGDYRTWPIYTQRRITNWRATQELALEAVQVAHLNALIGKLQARLQVRSMDFIISGERRREIEEGLTYEALDRFRERAGAIAERLGARGYDIVQLQIHDDSARPPPITLARTMGMPEDSAVASEPGTSRIGVTVHAVIRLRD